MRRHEVRCVSETEMTDSVRRFLRQSRNMFWVERIDKYMERIGLAKEEKLAVLDRMLEMFRSGRGDEAG